MEVRKCAKCGASSAKDAVDAARSYHRFPLPNMKNFERLKKWAQFMYPNQTFKTLESLAVLYKQHKVLCSAHFLKPMIYSSGYLSKFAVPSIEATEENRRLEEISTKDTQTQGTQLTAQDSSASTLKQEAQIKITTSSKSLKLGKQGLKLMTVSTSTTNVQAGTICVAQDEPQTLKKPAKSKVRLTILKDLSVNKINHITQRKYKLYHNNKMHLKEIVRLQETCRKLNSIRKIKILHLLHLLHLHKVRLLQQYLASCK